MSVMRSLIAAAALTLAGAGAAQAQDWQAWYAGQVQQQQAQQNAVINGIVQQNMRNPQVLAMWKTCGAGLTLEQFAYKYAATGGCSAQGYANYNATTNQIGAQQRAAADAYYRSVDAYRQAYGNYTNGYAANQAEAGRVMQGNQTYYDPSVGKNVQLRYIQPGQSYRDPSTGRTYAMDARGQYWSTNGNGQWTPVNPAARAPR